MCGRWPARVLSEHGHFAASALGCSAVAATTRGTSSASEEDRGLASGLLNSAAQIGTALGLAVFFTLAAARTEALAGGEATPGALVGGYRWAFFGAAGLALIGALVVLVQIRDKPGCAAG